MARLFALVVLAAAIVPTAVLGGGSAGFVYASPAGYSTVRQVERAFAADRIHLAVKRTEPSQEYWTKLAGQTPRRLHLDVEVYVPARYMTPGPQYESFLSAYVISSSTSSEPPLKWVGVTRGNVTVSWSTRRPWRMQAAQIRAVLDRLPYPRRATVRISCEMVQGLGLTSCGA